MILSLPLCSHDDITKQSGYLNKESKFNFVMGFQKLFSEMQILDAHSISTEHLNKAFGWEKVEHLQQHDMHEAMRVILDTLERALEGTPASAQAKSNFKYLLDYTQGHERQVHQLPGLQQIKGHARALLRAPHPSQRVQFTGGVHPRSNHPGRDVRRQSHLLLKLRRQDRFAAGAPAGLSAKHPDNCPFAVRIRPLKAGPGETNHPFEL